MSNDIQALIDQVDELNTSTAGSPTELTAEGDAKVPESAMHDLAPDDAIFVNGPSRAEIEAMKSAYPHSIVMATMLADGCGIVWRTLNRAEWKAVQASTRAIADTDRKEEIIFSKVVLFPNCQDPITVLNMPAGAITSVMNEFYLYSGFQPVTESLRL